MTNEQYEKLVELVDSIEFIDKELIDTNKFIAKFHKIFSKDYEAPSTCPWAEKPNVLDVETQKIIQNRSPSIPTFYPFPNTMQITYDSSPEHNQTSSTYTIDIPEEYKFTKCNKTNGVDGMEFTVDDDNTHSIHKAPREIQCGDQEASLCSRYIDPRDLDTV